MDAEFVMCEQGSHDDYDPSIHGESSTQGAKRRRTVNEHQNTQGVAMAEYPSMRYAYNFTFHLHKIN